MSDLMENAVDHYDFINYPHDENALSPEQEADLRAWRAGWCREPRTFENDGGHLVYVDGVIHEVLEAGIIPGWDGTTQLKMATYLPRGLYYYILDGQLPTADTWHGAIQGAVGQACPVGTERDFPDRAAAEAWLKEGA